MQTIIKKDNIQPVYSDKAIDECFLKHGFYANFKYIGDIDLVCLIIINQAKNFIKKAVLEVTENKKICKREVKYYCNMLYNPNGKTNDVHSSRLPFVGWTKRVENLISRNLDESEKKQFDAVNGYYFQLTNIELLKLKNTVTLSMSKLNLKNESLVSGLVAALLYGNMCKHVLQMLLEKNAGNVVRLCKDCYSDESKRSSFTISSMELDNALACMYKLIDAMTPHISIEIPENSPVGIIATKITQIYGSANYVYEIADSIGLDIRKSSNKMNFPENYDERAKERRVDLDAYYEKEEAIKETKRKAKEAREQEKIESIEDAFADKGWKIA